MLCMYRKKTRSICRVGYYLQFQASSGGLGMCPQQIRGDYRNWKWRVRMWILFTFLTTVLWKQRQNSKTLEGGRDEEIQFVTHWEKKKKYDSQVMQYLLYNNTNWHKQYIELNKTGSKLEILHNDYIFKDLKNIFQ